MVSIEPEDSTKLVVPEAEIQEHTQIERTQYEQALAESAERYRFLADTMPQIMWSVEPDGSITYYNQRWYEYTGFSKEEATNSGFLKTIHPDDQSTILKQWRQSFDSGNDFVAEMRLLRASDQQYRWHLCRSVPFRDKSNKIVQWIGTSTDIDDQKQAEEYQKKINNLQRTFLRDVLASVTEGKLRLCFSLEELSQLLSKDQDYIPLLREDLATIRTYVNEICQRLQFDNIRCQDILTAVGEAAMNAVVHGGGGIGRVCSSRDTLQFG